MEKNKLNRLFTLGMIFVVVYVFICCTFDYHEDGKAHTDCLLCQHSSFLHSVQTECTFVLNNNYEFVFKIIQSNLKISFLISIQDFFIRPPPIQV